MGKQQVYVQDMLSLLRQSVSLAVWIFHIVIQAAHSFQLSYLDKRDSKLSSTGIMVFSKADISFNLRRYFSFDHSLSRLK